MKSFDDLFERLLTALQNAEKRHRVVRDSASDSSDWSTYDNESELISSIIKWRRGLEQLHAEIDASGAITDEDIPNVPKPITENQPLPAINIYKELAQVDMLSRFDDELVFRKTANEVLIPAETKLTGITLLGKEYPVGTWNEMYIKVCEIMLLHSPYKIAAMDKDAEFNTEQQIYFSYIRSDIKFNGKRLSNGLWVETNMNNQATLNKCRRLLEKCELSPDELQVETMEVI